MNAPSWERIKEAFQDALERPPNERRRWLRERCGADRSLRAEVESLLATHDEAGGFAEQPAIEVLRAFEAGHPGVVAGARTAQPGDRLGVYEIISLVGAGGMGEVYKARDTRLDRLVAIKVLPADLAADSDRYRRFEREARAVASLDHPHIGALYDVGDHEGLRFLVMQYLEGETLAVRLTKGPLPLDQALRFAVDIADALDHAHRRGIVHRDLKPGNVVVTKAGATLLDFGLAKWRAYAGSGLGGAPPAPAMVPDSLTDEGLIVGTLPYMAPEQVEGKDIDARTDVFAFGVVVYEMVTGRKAFDGDSSARVIAAILGAKPPSIATLRSFTSPALDHVVATCLAKDPDSRWQSAGDVARQLRWIAETIASASAITAPSGSTTARRAVSRRAAIALLAAGVAGGALVGSQIHGRNAQPLQVTRSVLVPPHPLDYEVALSPDGTRLAYVADGLNGIQLYIQSLHESDAKMIADDACCPFFSPDSRWLGFTSVSTGAGGQLKKVPVSGGLPQTICDKGAPLGATWGSDGTIVFTPSEREGLYLVPASGGSPRVLTTLQPGEMSHRFPQFLPGSKAAVFTIKPPEMQSYDEARVGVVSIETGARHEVLKGGTNPRFAATGDLLYVSNGSVIAVPFDPGRLESTGHSVAVLDDVNVTNQGYAQFSVADNGLAAYVRRDPRPEVGPLTWVDRDGKRVPFTDIRVRGGNPRLSPDGQRLALTFFGPNDQIWIYDLARRTFSRLTTSWNNMFRSWTPDGKRIIFLSDRAGPFDLYWQVADGSQPAERLTANSKGKDGGTWSPDGRVFLFTQDDPPNHSEIWALTVRSGSEPALRPFIQTSSSNTAPAISPDGHWLAYTSNETGRWEVYVQPFPDLDAKWQVSNEGAGTGPRWEPVHGRELYYRNGDGMMMVEVTTRPKFSAAAPRLLFKGPYTGGFDVARDGRFLIMNERDPSEIATKQIALVQNWFEELKQHARTR